MNEKRINWIDWAKAICIYLMICGHSHPTLYIHDFLYQFHLPVFFIISGILYKPKAIKELVISLLVPVIVWNLINYPWYIYNLLNIQKELSINTLILQPFFGLFIHDFQIGVPICGPFWFVLVIFIMRLYHQITSRLKLIQLISICTCILVAYISNESPQKNILFLFQRAVIAYPFFFFGTFLKENPSILNTIKRNKILLFIISIIILIIFPIFKGSFDLYTCQLNIFPTYYIIGFIGFIFIYLLSSKMYATLGAPLFIQNISNGTLVILGLHNITLFTLSKITHHINFIGRGELFSILTILILYFPTIYIINKIPFLIGKNIKYAHKKYC